MCSTYLYLWKPDNEIVLMVIYVVEACGNGETCVANEFEMTDDGEIRCFPGLRIDRDVKSSSMRISHKQYLQDILECFKMVVANQFHFDFHGIG